MGNKQTIRIPYHEIPIQDLPYTASVLSNRNSALNTCKKVLCFNKSLCSSYTSAIKSLRENFGLSYSFANTCIIKIKLSYDDKTIFALCEDFSIHVWRIDESFVCYVLSQDEKIVDFFVSVCDKIVFYCMEFRICVWGYEGNNDNFFYVWEKDKAGSCFAIGNNWKYIGIGHNEGSISILDNKGTLFCIIATGQNPILSLVFMKNNEILASAGGNENNNDYTIKIWSLINNNIIAALGGHALPVYSLQTCENQKLLFSLSKDSTLRVWNLEKIYLLATEKVNSKKINKMCLLYSNTISKAKNITVNNSNFLCSAIDRITII